LSTGDTPSLPFFLRLLQPDLAEGAFLRGLCVRDSEDKIQAPLRQFRIALVSIKLGGMSGAERSAVIARLARLLMEAAGVESEERGDDGS
jgi:hypothetical protein